MRGIVLKAWRFMSVLAAGGWLACAPLPLLAEAEGRPARDAAVQAGVAEAARLGELMYLYDQAAWHATDSMVEGFDQALTPLMRGYIVVPGAAGQLDTIFYGEVDGTLVEMARFAVRGSEVVGGGWLPANGRRPLSDEVLRLVAARQTAINYASSQQFRLCERTTPNTVVLPPDPQGTIAVYILTPPVANDAYPLGGHYRLEVDATGAVARSRNFMNTCMMARYGAGDGGEAPVAMVVSHLLDDHPTEIHAFVSRYVPISLMVATIENRAMWLVEKGAIRYQEQIPE